MAKAAYHSTTVSRRGSLHLRADRELERRGAPAIARAGHVANSFDPARPDRYLTLALGATQALSTDPATAEGWLEAAEARLAGNHPHWRQTQLLLGRARLNLGRFDDSRATFLQLTHGSTPEQTAAVLHTGRIERLLGRYQEAEALLRAGLSRATSAAARATGLYELSAVAAECSEFTDSDRLATEAARLAEAAGDQLLRCTALAASAWARTSLGDIAGAQASVSAAATVVDAMADAQAAQDIDCLRLIGQTELVLDRLTDAARHLDRGVRLARHNGQRHVLPNLLKSQAELEFRLGRLDRAGLVLDEAEPLSAETGVVIIQTLVATIRAGTLLWHRPSAQSAESLAAAESAMAHSAGAGNGLTWRLHAQGALGETLVFTGQAGHGSQIMLTAGGGPLLPRLAAHRRVRWWEILAFAAVAGSDLARAEEFAALAVEAAQSAPTDIRLGFAYRARALVENAKGATAAALVAGQLAAARFTAAGAQLDLGRTHLLLAGAELSAGRVEAASDHLAMAGALARRCQAARLSEQVEAELARLPSRPRGIDWQARLTTRERDIAELAGQALASTTIAARLHLSVRTVDSYLGKIYRKLGVTNRVALANLLRAAQPETES